MREDIREFGLGVHVEDVNSDFILATFAPSVKEKLAVFRSGFNRCASGMVFRPRQGIEQHFVWRVLSAANVNFCKVLVGEALGKEIPATMLARSAERIRAQEFAQAPGNGCAARKLRKCSLGAFLLLLDPPARLLAVLILKPAIGVNYISGCVGVMDIFHRGRWRAFCRCFLRTCRVCTEIQNNREKAHAQQKTRASARAGHSCWVEHFSLAPCGRNRERFAAGLSVRDSITSGGKRDISMA